MIKNEDINTRSKAAAHIRFFMTVARDNLNSEI